MAVGMGPSRGMSGGGFSNYNYKTVPGQNSVGNWNTGGQNYGFGNQGGIKPYGLAALPSGYERPKPPKKEIFMQPLPPLQPIPPAQPPAPQPVAQQPTPIQQLMAGAAERPLAVGSGPAQSVAASYPNTFGPRAPGSWPSYPVNHTGKSTVFNNSALNNPKYGGGGYPGLNGGQNWGGGNGSGIGRGGR